MIFLILLSPFCKRFLTFYLNPAKESVLQSNMGNSFLGRIEMCNREKSAKKFIDLRENGALSCVVDNIFMTQQKR